MAEAKSSKGPLFGAADDLSLPSPPSPLAKQSFEYRHVRERSNSESDLAAESPGLLSYLAVDKNILNLSKICSVKVSWDIKEEIGADDWIGLYQSGTIFMAFKCVSSLHNKPCKLMCRKKKKLERHAWLSLLDLSIIYKWSAKISMWDVEVCKQETEVPHLGHVNKASAMFLFTLHLNIVWWNMM